MAKPVTDSSLSIEELELFVAEQLSLSTSSVSATAPQKKGFVDQCACCCQAIGSLITGVVKYHVAVNYRQAVEEFIACQGLSCDPEITTVNFPVQHKGESMVLIHLIEWPCCAPIDELVHWFDGYRPAIIQEVLCLAKYYPEVMKTHAVLAPGSPALIGGFGSVFPFVCQHKRGLGVFLHNGKNSESIRLKIAMVKK